VRRLAALAAAAALLAAPAGAAARPLLDSADASELAAMLAEAQEEQGICYGWYVEVQDDDHYSASGVDQGSGPGGPLATFDRSAPGCERYAVLVARIHYTSESSESDDSARLSVDTNLGPPVSNRGLERLGLTGGDLLGSGDDTSLINMVGALPLLAAESGAAPFVPYEPNTAPLMAGERPTGSPGSDWWRKFWPYVLVLAIVCGLAGYPLGWKLGGGSLTEREGPSTPRARHIRSRPLP
jgi:hypothetical protein